MDFEQIVNDLAGLAKCLLDFHLELFHHHKEERASTILVNDNYWVHKIQLKMYVSSEHEQ